MTYIFDPPLTQLELIYLNETVMRITKAQIEAKLEALSGMNTHLSTELRRANEEIAVLRAQLQPAQTLVNDQRRIMHRGALLQELKRLVASGVPCHMRGDYIFHARTSAILAQVQQP